MGDNNKHVIWTPLLSLLLLATKFFSKKNGSSLQLMEIDSFYAMVIHWTTCHLCFVSLIPSTRIFLVKAVYMVLGSSYFSSGEILVLGRSIATHKYNPGSSKIAAYLVSFSRLLCLAFLYGWWFLNKISLDW